MKELIIHIVQALVDNPEEIQVNEIKGGNTKVYDFRNILSSSYDRLQQTHPSVSEHPEYYCSG